MTVLERKKGKGGRPPICDEIRKKIRKARESKGLSYRELEREFGVAHTSAWRICKEEPKE